MIETVGKGVVSLVNYRGRVGVTDDTKGVSVFVSFLPPFEMYTLHIVLTIDCIDSVTDYGFL